MATPVIAIASDRTVVFGHEAHLGLHGYVRAVVDVIGGLPLLLPAIGPALDLDALIDSVDGVLLTGSPSNVAPACYGGPPLPEGAATDEARDATTLAQIPQLVRAGVPVLGVCRGLQEMNVAYGGSLHAAVHQLPGHLDHREGDHSRPVARWYDDSHPVQVQPGGLLARVLGPEGAQRELTVNSLHHQGIQRLGAGLRVEALAPDGLVEGISVADAPQFALGVQWHPEMRIDDSPAARAIFTAFGQACRDRQAQRLAARRSLP
jgi:putative glutamine amidotransferase